ncbi:MAG: hypothetical protein WA126_15440 [Thermodesulfovibrionales bacterium]
MQHNDEKKEKQAYKKPRLRIIELTAEEVLAIGCKTATGRPGQSSPTGCGTASCSVTFGS